LLGHPRHPKQLGQRFGVCIGDDVQQLGHRFGVFLRRIYHTFNEGLAILQEFWMMFESYPIRSFWRFHWFSASLLPCL
jgi:hypothetical protein